MPKIKSIRGMNDITPLDISVWQSTEKSVRSIFTSYGYQEIRLPLVERTELFARGVGKSTDIVSKDSQSPSVASNHCQICSLPRSQVSP